MYVGQYNSSAMLFVSPSLYISVSVLHCLGGSAHVPRLVKIKINDPGSVYSKILGNGVIIRYESPCQIYQRHQVVEMVVVGIFI